MKTKTMQVRVGGEVYEAMKRVVSLSPEEANPLESRFHGASMNQLINMAVIDALARVGVIAPDVAAKELSAVANLRPGAKRKGAAEVCVQSEPAAPGADPAPAPVERADAWEE